MGFFKGVKRVSNSNSKSNRKLPTNLNKAYTAQVKHNEAQWVFKPMSKFGSKIFIRTQN